MRANQDTFANPKRRKARFIAAVLLLLLGFTWTNGNKVQAQDADTESKWSAPLNLSNSGSAKKPFLVKDTNNNPLVFWEDTFSGFQYRYFLDGSWSEPGSFPMPFGNRSVPLNYRVINGNNGNAYVFWVDSGKRLYTSNLSLTAVDNFVPWKTPQLISRDIENFGVAVDEDGNLHVAYVLGQDTDTLNAGVYYTRISPQREILRAVEMDQSPYFRRSSDVSASGEFDPSVATVGIGSYGSGPETTVLLSWNNPVTKRLFLRRSVNAGADWEEPLEIVSPDEQSPNQIPQKPEFTRVGNTIDFLWQYNQVNVSCMQYIQSSTDLGVTWSERQVLLGELSGCPEQNTVYHAGEQEDFLFSILSNQVYLSIFKDGELESPQLQGELSGFADSTTFNNIRLQTQQALIVGDQLYLAGAGTGSSSDIWIFSRSIESIFETIGAKPAWSNQKTIAQGQDPVKNIFIFTSESNLVHAFWSQPEGGEKSDPGTAIYYAGWVELTELTPRSILRSPEGKSDQPSAVVDANGRMYVVWSGGKSGELYFSYSDTKQASTQLDWFDPVPLSLTSGALTNPILKVGLDGTLYVAYLTPLNEQRGVYVTSSQDRGTTWSVPVQVFDAVGQNCEMLEHLSFVISSEGTQHLAWMCSTIPGGTGAYALDTARSSDQGQNWSVKRDETEKHLVWGEITGLSQDNIHLIWLENAGGLVRLKYQISVDDGETWRAADEIDSFRGEVGPSTLAVEPGGQIYLMVTSQETGKVNLNSWYWNGKSWDSLEQKKIVSGQIGLIDSLAAVVLPEGELGVLFSVENTGTTSGLQSNSLNYLSHPIKIGPAVANAGSQQENPTASQPTPAGVDSLPATPVVITATPQPTLDLASLKEVTSPGTSSIIIYLIGGILALVVVILAVIVSQYNRLNK